MRPKENLISWKVFLKTARTLNVSRTAIELDMDLKTVSRMVKELETDLGVLLFDRTVRPFKLTEVAIRLLPEAENLIQCSEKLNKTAESISNRPQSLSLSLPVNMTRGDLFPLLSSYTDKHPNLQIHLINDCDHRHILDGETDIAMLPYLPDNNDDSLLVFDAGFSYNMLLATPSYLKQHGVPYSTNDLKSHNLILRYSRIYPTTTFIEHGQNRVFLNEEFKLLYLGDAFSCREAALSSQGIAIDLSVAFCKEDISSGRLIPVLPGFHRPVWNMTVAMRKSDEHKKYLVDFASWFAKKQKQAYPERWKPIYEKYGVQP